MERVGGRCLRHSVRSLTVCRTNGACDHAIARIERELPHTNPRSTSRIELHCWWTLMRSTPEAKPAFDRPGKPHGRDWSGFLRPVPA